MKHLIDQLREAASRATPGPYYAYPFILFAGKEAIASATDHTTKATFEYFSVCSPENILTLITELERLREMEREAREAMIEIRGNYCTESGYYSCGAPCKDEARTFLSKWAAPGEGEK